MFWFWKVDLGTLKTHVEEFPGLIFTFVSFIWQVSVTQLIGLRQKNTWNSHIPWENLWFPVIFPLNQPLEWHFSIVVLDCDGEELQIDLVSSDHSCFDPRSAMFTENYSAEAKAPSALGGWSLWDSKVGYPLVNIQKNRWVQWSSITMLFRGKPTSFRLGHFQQLG